MIQGARFREFRVLISGVRLQGSDFCRRVFPVKWL